MNAFRHPYSRLLVGAVLTATTSLGLRAQADYFQQRADYVMEATLSPASHTLSVTGTLTYTNNSPSALDSIALHLWANAYSHRESAFAKQKLRLNSTRFAFAPEEDLGGYRDLTFSGQQVARTSRPNPELAWAHLAQPLSPGQSLELDFAYDLRIPKSFSRLGRAERSYQLTQWFPKPAVYDTDGWHIMPYLDLGEFYCEFGDYDVTINVPENGLVAGTGELVNDAGIQARERRIAATGTADTLRFDSLGFGESLTAFRYRASDVHDFAFFVDTRFRVRVDTADLTRGSIPAYVFYPASEEQVYDSAAYYLARATAFADSIVGTYPYPAITAVSAPIGVSSAGAMEYPTITVVGKIRDPKALDVTIAHEAFHNWFQGMLASNERTHAWLDEGLTSWLEAKYTRAYYEEDENPLGLPKFLAGGSTYDEGSLLHALLANAHRHPAPDTHSDSISGIGYGYAAYSQPQMLFEMLEAQVGAQELERRIRGYFDTWHHRHPGPEDLQAALGGAEVDWLFDDLLFDAKLPDYEIADVEVSGSRATVRIVNASEVASPFPLAFQLEDDSYTADTWYEGFVGERELELRVPAEAWRLGLDAQAKTPEVDRDDNYYALSGLTPKLEPLAVHIGTHLGRADRNDLNIVPTVGYNATDGVMLGVGFHDYVVTQDATRFYLLPMVSTRDGALAGMAGLKHSLYRDNSWWRELEFSATGRQYHYNFNNVYDFSDRFQRGTFGVELLLAAEAGVPLDQRIGVRAHVVDLLFARGIDADAGIFSKEDGGYTILEADYNIERNHPLTPWEGELQAQGGEGFARLSGTLSGAYKYHQRGSFLRGRVFAGAFLSHDDPEARALLLPNGVTGFRNNQYDYTFEEFIVDRSETSNQVFVRDGSLTLPFLLPVFGSDSWLASVSLEADLPVNLSVIDLSTYVDAAFYPDSRPDASGTVAPITGGVRVGLLKLIDVSFPVFNSAFVKEALPFNVAEPEYTERIAFRLHLDRLNIEEALRKLRG